MRLSVLDELEQSRYQHQIVSIEDYLGSVFFSRFGETVHPQILNTLKKVILIRSTGSANYVYSASGEEVQVVLDRRWLEVALSLLRLNLDYTACSLRIGGTESVDHRHLASVGTGLFAAVVIEHLLNPATESLGVAGALCAEFSKELDDFREYYEQRVIHTDDFTKTYHFSHGLLPYAMVFHEVTHCYPAIASREFRLLKSKAVKLLKMLPGSCFDLTYAIPIDGMQSLVTNSREAVAYALTDPQSMVELACDMGMYKMTLPFRFIAREQGNFERDETADAWVCNMLSLYVELNTRVSEMHYAARSAARGQWLAIGDDIMRFVAEATARRRLAHIAPQELVIAEEMPRWWRIWQRSGYDHAFLREFSHISNVATTATFDALLNAGKQRIWRTLQEIQGSSLAQNKTSQEAILIATGYH